MERAHEVTSVSIAGTLLRLCVDGRFYEKDLAGESKRLATATSEQLARFEVSPVGYGIHWPDLDEDLSIDGLLGVVHECPLVARKV